MIFQIKRFVLSCSLMTVLVSALVLVQTASADNFRMFVGEIKALNLGDIQRVAVGNGKLISTSILDNGKLLILAEEEGDTELQIWLGNGKVVAHHFYVIKQNATRNANEIRDIVGYDAGIEILQVGKNVVLKGEVSNSTSDIIKKLIEVYSNIVNLTKPTAGTDIEKIFEDIPDLKIKRAGDNLIISGDVSSDDKIFISAASQAYPGLIDLTRGPEIENKPMVHMYVQITEFTTNALEDLGINWQNTGIAGPSIGYAQDFARTNGTSVLQNSDVLTVADGITSSGNGIGYFGIASMITSTINIAVESGDALVLASPTLSARSGSKAEFLAGGEFPVSVPGGVNGNTIEFKEYGIKLNIEPVVGRDGVVVATVETEVSDIDIGVSVDGVPGLKTNKTKTEVNLKQNETLAISGLVKRNNSEAITKVKFLGDIPILGRLFRSENFRNNKSELVVFISPQVYDPTSEENIKRIARATEMRETFLKNIDSSEEILD